MTTKPPFDDDFTIKPFSDQLTDIRITSGAARNETVELFYSWVRKGQLTHVRITTNATRYGRVQRFRNWLYRQAPWLPSWVTGWITVHYRRPERPFPDA